MTTLEQRIKEAAEKAIITGLASQGKRHLGVEYLSAHTALEDFWQLISPESIKALLAEKDAALHDLSVRWKLAEQLGIYTDVNGAIYNKALTDAQVKSGTEIESLKAEIADLKTQLEQEASADIQINEQIGNMYAEIERLKALKVYDALSGPREGEQE